MADQTTADILVERLIDWGVDTIFGLPGDGINGIMESLRKRQDDIRFIHVRHEEAAAFMACGYAKFTGRLGVCLATSGPGGIHLLNGLYDAKLDRQPVLAITGMAYHDLCIPSPSKTSSWTSCSWMWRSTTSASWVKRTSKARVDLAVRAALAYKGVSHITFPADMQEMQSRRALETQQAAPHVRRPGAISAQFPTKSACARPPTSSTRQMKPVILAGQGALDATDQLEQLAETARRADRQAAARQGLRTG